MSISKSYGISPGINMDSLVKMANILDKTRIELLKEMRNDPI